MTGLQPNALQVDSRVERLPMEKREKATAWLNPRGNHPFEWDTFAPGAFRVATTAESVFGEKDHLLGKRVVVSMNDRSWEDRLNPLAERRPVASRHLASWLSCGMALAFLFGLQPEPAVGQAEVRNFTQPIPMLNTGGHTAPVRALIFAPPDGLQLLSAGLDKTVNVWNLREAPPGHRPDDPPPDLAWVRRGDLRDGPVARRRARRPATPGRGRLRRSGQPRRDRPLPVPGREQPADRRRPRPSSPAARPARNPDGHLGVVVSLAFHPRGGFLASASHDTTVRIWNLQTGATVAVLKGQHTRPVNAVAYLPDGRHLVSGGADGQVLLWDVDRRAVVARSVPDPC